MGVNSLFTVVTSFTHAHEAATAHSQLQLRSHTRGSSSSSATSVHMLPITPPPPSAFFSLLPHTPTQSSSAFSSLLPHKSKTQDTELRDHKTPITADRGRGPAPTAHRPRTRPRYACIKPKLPSDAHASSLAQWDPVKAVGPDPCRPVRTEVSL